MPTRRRFGSVRRLASGRWQARYRTEDGRMVSGGTFATRRDAERWLSGVETDLARGALASPGTTTVAELARWWLATVVPGQVRSELSIDHYRRIVELHLLPVLGDVLVAELSATQVDDWLASRSHLARSYLARMRSTLAQILRHGQRRGMVRSNVATIAVVPPAKAPAGRRSLTAADAQALISAAEGEPLAAMFTVGLCLGLRPGELAGLLWEDIDLDADPPTLSITGSVKQRSNGAVWRDSEPKRATASRRTLALPPVAARALTAQRKASGRSEGLVFSTAPGNPVSQHHIYSVFARVARRAGVEGGFPYLMRHSAASLMLDAGASLDEVADVLGDDPATLLRHYRHRVRPVASGGLRMGEVLDPL